MVNEVFFFPTGSLQREPVILDFYVINSVAGPQSSKHQSHLFILYT